MDKTVLLLQSKLRMLVLPLPARAAPQVPMTLARPWLMAFDMTHLEMPPCS
jgi:hypothetical protein